MFASPEPEVSRATEYRGTGARARRLGGQGPVQRRQRHPVVPVLLRGPDRHRPGQGDLLAVRRARRSASARPSSAPSRGASGAASCSWTGASSPTSGAGAGRRSTPGPNRWWTRCPCPVDRRTDRVSGAARPLLDRPTGRRSPRRRDPPLVGPACASPDPPVARPRRGLSRLAPSPALTRRRSGRWRGSPVASAGVARLPPSLRSWHRRHRAGRLRRRRRVDARLTDPGAASRRAARSRSAARTTGTPLPDHSYERLDGGDAPLRRLPGQAPGGERLGRVVPPVPAGDARHSSRCTSELGDRCTSSGSTRADDRSEAKDLAARTGVTYDLLYDPKADFVADMGVVALPTTLFVDADGNVVSTQDRRRWRPTSCGRKLHGAVRHDA